MIKSRKDHMKNPKIICFVFEAGGFGAHDPLEREGPMGWLKSPGGYVHNSEWSLGVCFALQ